MAAINIKSENPHLSYVLRKNPSTGLIGKSNRKGNCFGYFINEQEYILVNFLKPEALSFTPDKLFNYLDYSVEAEGMSYATTMNVLIKDALKKPIEYDVEGKYKTEVTLVCLYVSRNLIHFLSKSFEEISYVELTKNSSLNKALFKITVTTSVSIKAALELAYIISVLASPKNSDYINANFVSSVINTLSGKTSTIEKKKKSFNQLVKSKEYQTAGRQYPYFLINKINQHLIRDRKIFDQTKRQLEELCEFPCQLSFGNLLENKQNYIKQNILSYSLIDIDSGESNSLYLSKKLQDESKYYLVEKDIELHAEINRLINRKNYSNVISPVVSIYDLTVSEPVQVLLNDVLKYKTQEQAAELLENIINQFEVKRLIITIPNRKFNIYYGIEENEMRGKEHKWEPSFEEFNKWILTVGILNNSTNYQFTQIGDCVNGATPSIGLVIDY